MARGRLLRDGRNLLRRLKVPNCPDGNDRAERRGGGPCQGPALGRHLRPRYVSPRRPPSLNQLS